MSLTGSQRSPCFVPVEMAEGVGVELGKWEEALLFFISGFLQVLYEDMNYKEECQVVRGGRKGERENRMGGEWMFPKRAESSKSIISTIYCVGWSHVELTAEGSADLLSPSQLLF